MDRRLYRFFQFLILAGLAAFLSVKYLSGSLSWYINQRYTPLRSSPFWACRAWR